MPPRRRKNGDKAAMASADNGEDRLTALPDETLLHILSCLPSDDAVWASVLARRWHHLWKSARALRVSPRLLRGGGRSPWSREKWTESALTSFMNHLLLLRGAAPVDECEILCGELHVDAINPDEYPTGYMYQLDDELNRTAGLWIRHALETCHARALRVRLRARRRLCLDGVHFAGRCLTTVELTDATFLDDGSSVDFSRCPALQDLTMSSCKITAGRICSPSLTRLSIEGCTFGAGRTRTRIYTPRLVSLELQVSSGRAPILERMPLLVAADVVLEDCCDDMCIHNVCTHWQRDHGSRDGCFCINEDGSGMYLENLASCGSCYGTDDGSSVVLEGLSGATDLELISDPRVFIFRKDCKSLTTFNNLKTLVLNEWCMAVDFSALASFSSALQFWRSSHCNLDTVSLSSENPPCFSKVFCSPQTRHPVVKTDGSYSPTEQSLLVSKQLVVVEIKCFMENELVKKLLMFLTTSGIPREQIQIEQNFSPPELSGYDTDSDYGDW